MNICIVTQRVLKGNGQGRVNYEVAWEALQRGHSVTLLASQIAPELQQYSQIRWIPIATKKFPTQLVQDFAFSIQSGTWLKQHRSEFDVVKVNGAITWMGGDVNAVHFVHSAWLQSPVHTSRLRRDYYGAYHWLYTILSAYWERKAFRQAKVVVAVSQKIGKELVDIGVSNKCIRVILNGVDLQEFFPGFADRKKLGLPEGATLALFAGDIQTNRKNLDTVLYALVQVPELHLVVVGTTEGSPYPLLAAKLGLSTRAHFLGYRCDISEIMRAVDLFVFPSRYEPFGMVVAEAMASGLPVITATTTGAAEIVTPQCGVVLPDSEDAHALSQVLRTLASNRELRNQMGQVGRAIAEQHSWVSKAQSYVGLFEEMSH